MATTPANTKQVGARPKLQRISSLDRPRTIAAHWDGSSVALWIGILERCCDLLAIFTSVWVADLLYLSINIGKRNAYATTWLLMGSIIYAGLYVMLLERSGEYKSGSLLGVRETERILRANWYTIFIIFGLAYSVNHSYSRLLLLLAAILAPLFVLMERQVAYRLIGAICRAKSYGKPALIYGSGRPARKVYSALLRSPKLGMKPIAFVDDGAGMSGKEIFEASYHRKNSAKVLPGPITLDLLRGLEVSSLILTETLPESTSKGILAAAREAGCTVYFAPGHSDSEEHALDYVEIDGLLLATNARTIEFKLYDAVKRCFDVVVSLLLLVVLAPVLLAVAAAVKFSSKGPILFVQERVGRRGKLFPMFKFRSMFTDAPAYAFSPQESGDPRITPVGRFLRRTSLDELPQLLNVVMGHMSLVGPRPEMPFIVERYNNAQRRRLDVTPGITGLWQLSADRAYLIHENIEYDLYYVRNRSFFLDLALLVHTALFAARGV
jgi:exopolysaccharide biosynthesis polyprenyl glycosylphosphotransferase